MPHGNAIRSLIHTALTVETDLQNCDDYRRDADALVAAPFRAAGLLVCRPHRLLTHGMPKQKKKTKKNKWNLVHIGYFLTNCSVKNYEKNNWIMNDEKVQDKTVIH